MEIPTGAICVMALVGKELDLDIPPASYGALFCAVWVIYLFDHLKDSRGTLVYTERRKFHQKNRSLFLLLIIISIHLGIVSLLQIAPNWLMIRTIYWGIVLSLACAMYLVVSHWLGLMRIKELAVAVCYAVGIFLIPSILSDSNFLWIMFIQVFLLAFLNLVTFSIFEISEDEQEGFHSIATKLGLKRARIIAILLVALLLTSVPLEGAKDSFSIFLAVGAITFGLMLLFPGYFSKHERFRILGDSIFLLAAVFLLF